MPRLYDGTGTFGSTASSVVGTDLDEVSPLAGFSIFHDHELLPLFMLATHEQGLRPEYFTVRQHTNEEPMGEDLLSHTLLIDNKKKTALPNALEDCHGFVVLRSPLLSGSIISFDVLIGT